MHIDHINVFVHYSTVIMKIVTMHDLRTLMLYGKLILFFNRNFAISGKIINSKYQIVLPWTNLSLYNWCMYIHLQMIVVQRLKLLLRVLQKITKVAHWPLMNISKKVLVAGQSIVIQIVSICTFIPDKFNQIGRYANQGCDNIFLSAIALRHSTDTLLNLLEFCSVRMEQILLLIRVPCTTIIVQANAQQIVSEDGITGLTLNGIKMDILMLMMVGALMKMFKYFVVRYLELRRHYEIRYNKIFYLLESIFT